MRPTFACGRLRPLLILLLLAPSAIGQIVGLSPKLLAFSSQVAGTTSITKKVTLQNTDAFNSLTITSVTASGNFTSTNTCGGTVGPLATCTISVNFSPSGAGNITGALTIIDNAPNSPHIVGLTGTGIGQVTVSPLTLNFGTVAISGNNTLSLKITNNTSTIANNLTFTPSGDYGAAPGSTSPCGSSLASKTSCNENITFAPTQDGSVNGLVIITDTAANSPQLVSTIGTGSGTNSAPITLSPGNLSFGKVVVGSTSASQTLTVTNTSAGSMTITISASGDYSETPGGPTPCGSNLNGLASCTVTVTFSPTTVGSLNGSVGVGYAGPDSPQLATLTGTGLAQVTTSTSSVKFAGQSVGTTSAASTVKLTNNTSATIAVSSITPSGNYAVLTGMTGDCSGSLGAKTSCNIRVVFSPTHSGFLQGAITVADGAATSPQIISLTGYGLAPPKFAYGASGNYWAYSADSVTGALTLIEQDLSQGATGIAIDPTGRFLYGADTGFNGVEADTVDVSTGLFTLVTGSPFPLGNGPWATAVDPSGRFLYVTNESDDTVTAATINLTTGVPTVVPGSPYAVPASPFGLTVDPMGRFVYVASQTGGNTSNVAAFSINSSTGALTSIGGSPFSAGTNAIYTAVDPAGKFLFVTNWNDQTVSVFTINQITGSLTQVKGSPFATGIPAGQILVVDPTGRFLYVADVAVRETAGHTINSVTGALTLMKDSPFPGGQLQGIQADPSGMFLYVCSATFYDDINQSTGELTQVNQPGPSCGRGVVVSGAVP